MSTNTRAGAVADVRVTSTPRNEICANRILVIEPRSLGEKRIEIAVLPSALERARDEVEIELRHRLSPQESDGFVVRRHRPRRPAIEQAGGIEERAQIGLMVVGSERRQLLIMPDLRSPSLERCAAQVAANLGQ